MSKSRDREPSGIPVKKLKRLLQKSKKLRVFLWKRILRIAPLLSQLHGYIRCRLRSQTNGRRIIIGLRFVKKVKKDPVEVGAKHHRFYSTRISSNNAFDLL